MILSQTSASNIGNTPQVMGEDMCFEHNLVI